MSFLRIVVYFCCLNVLLGVYLLGSMHERRQKHAILVKYFEDASENFLTNEDDSTQQVVFLRETTSAIISALASNKTISENRRVKKFNDYLDVELSKTAQTNVTEFFDLFKYNELFKNLLEQPLTKRHSLIESYVMLQITMSAFLQHCSNDLKDLQTLLKKMLIKTHSEYLVEHSQLMVNSPSTYISTHYKSFYLS